MMSTITIQAPPRLSHLVSQILVIDQENDSGVATALPFYADGLPGIVFHQSRETMYLNDQNQKLSSLLLYGQTVTPITLLPHGSFRLIMFLLYPSTLSRLFGIRSVEVTDICVDLGLLPASGLLSYFDLLLETTDVNKQISIISQYLSRQSEHSPIESDSIIHFALEHIIASKGLTTLNDLTKRLHVTERTLERKFDQHVGVSPRLFSRICQFRSSIRQLDELSFGKLSDVAYHNGFADQSHFIRSFKQFTGLSPLQYMRRQGA